MNNNKELRVLELINEALYDHGKLPITQFNKTDSLKDDLGIDSLTMVDIVVKFEDEFGIDIFEGGMIYSVKELLNVVSRDEQ